MLWTLPWTTGLGACMTLWTWASTDLCLKQDQCRITLFNHWFIDKSNCKYSRWEKAILCLFIKKRLKLVAKAIALENEWCIWVCMLFFMAFNQLKNVLFKIKVEENDSRTIEAYLCSPKVPGSWFKNYRRDNAWKSRY